MTQFVETIQQHAILYTKKLERIKHRQEKPSFHKEVKIHEIPADYAKFKGKNTFEKKSQIQKKK
jgi:hypothetical protein